MGFKLAKDHLKPIKRIPRSKNSSRMQLFLFRDYFPSSLVNHQNAVRELSKEQYAHLEKLAAELFEKDPRFSENGKVNLALLTSLLWWSRANRSVSEDQYSFDGFFNKISLPFSQELIIV